MPGCRILLVEDHVDTVAVLTRLLKISGHCVLAAESGQSALALAAQQAFDLLLIDLGLPDFDGRALLPKLREICAAPAIAMTGFGMEEDVDSCTAAGFACHLTKPIAFESLLTSVSELCSSSAPATH